MCVRQSLFPDNKIKIKKGQSLFFSLKLQIGNTFTVNSSLKYKKGQKALPSSRAPETGASFAYAGSRKNLPGENPSHEPAQGLVLTAALGR
jgi:hypothetical protein